MGCEDGRWMELARDRVQWRALVLAVLNLRVLLPESYLLYIYILLIYIIYHYHSFVMHDKATYMWLSKQV
jgi:hypothetical protein